MEKKKIWIDKIVIVLLLIVALMMGCTLVSSYQDISQVRANLTEKSLKQNVYIHGKWIHQLFNSCLNEIDGVAVGASLLNMDDVASLNRILQGHNDVFNDMGFIDLEGETICGGEFALGNLQNEPFYEDLMQGKGVIAPKLYTDAAGDRGFYFLAPVMKDNQVKMILVGAYMENSMIQNLDGGAYFGSGCVCIISEEGDYIMGGASFDKILGDKEKNHFTHIGSVPARQLTNAFSQGITANVEYKYAGQEYAAYYTPLGINGWYLCATVFTEEAAMRDSALELRSKILLLLLLLLSVALLFAVIFLLRDYYRSRKVIHRQELIQQCDKAISFELTFKPYTLRFYGDVKDVIGTDPGELVGEAVYGIYDWVHEDDISVRSKVEHFLDSREENFAAEVRIRNIKGNYGWYRIVGIMQRARKYTNSLFVGKIINVDEELAEEHDLMQRAENDLLTGVLNKKTMEKRVSLMLKNRGSEYVIFYMVDLDNFKNVNDKLGHIYGDQAIVETAQALNKVFSDKDCIGRLGGDEFTVCVTYRAFDEQNLMDFIRKKGDKICQVNRRTYSDGASEVSISSSVGIAYAPNMGESFEELYTKADKALYYSKENGKNGYHIYTKADQ